MLGCYLPELVESFPRKILPNLSGPANVSLDGGVSQHDVFLEPFLYLGVYVYIYVRLYIGA